MRTNVFLLIASLLLVATSSVTMAQSQQPDPNNEDVRTLVGRLDLTQYKTTLKGLTQFGDRRQGTERNRQAIDWIEAQLQSVGCATTERIDYIHDPAPRNRSSRRRSQNPLNVDGPHGNRQTDWAERLRSWRKFNLWLSWSHWREYRSNESARRTFT